jgi:hypothetical protein
LAEFGRKSIVMTNLQNIITRKSFIQSDLRAAYMGGYIGKRGRKDANESARRIRLPKPH